MNEMMLWNPESYRKLLPTSITLSMIDAFVTAYNTFLRGNHEDNPILHLLINRFGYLAPFLWLPVEVILVPTIVLLLLTFYNERLGGHASIKHSLVLMFCAFFLAIESNVYVILFGLPK